MNTDSQQDRGVLDLRAGLPEWFSGTGRLPRLLFLLIEKLLGYDRLDRLFSAAARSGGEESYLEKLADGFDLRVVARGESSLPGEGPLVVVANHPFGGADAIALGSCVIRKRPDTRILANAFLASVKPLQSWLIGVDVYGGEGAAGRNLGGLKAASRHLANGGCLVVFPAGEVASWQWSTGRVEEPPWSSHAAALAIRHRAVVVPVRIPGRNSAFFQLLGALHPSLRTAWLGRELLRARGGPIRLVVGDPISVSPDERKELLTAQVRDRILGELPSE